MTLMIAIAWPLLRVVFAQARGLYRAISRPALISSVTDASRVGGAGMS
jgi:hypothetical protein